MENNIYKIKTNAALHIGMLSLGVAGIQISEYVDTNSNQRKTRRTIGMWLGIKNKPELAVRVTGFKGFKIDFQAYTIEVQDVNENDVVVHIIP